MGLFQKKLQHITVSSENKNTLEDTLSRLQKRNVKDAKISSIKSTDGQWQYKVSCNVAETVLIQEILPLLNDADQPHTIQVLVEFDDDSKLVGACPIEILVSFDLNSGRPFGSEDENGFIRQLHSDVSQDFDITPAGVCYYILGGATVTMCIPSADPKKMESYVKDELIEFGVKKVMVTVVDRANQEIVERHLYK